MARLARFSPIDHSPNGEVEIRAPRLRTRFYAFLSYSHKDKELADWLHRELEKFRVPHSLAGKLTPNGVVPRRLVPIFRDQQDLSAGGDLADEIKAALAASQFLVVLCSPTAAKSRWTNQEIESFKRTRPESCVLAAIAKGEPFASDLPGREEEECFPPALRFKYDRRGHQTAKRADPLAADFRLEAEGKRLAFLKLVAGMLGVGLDELVQREQTRRQRQLAFVAAASLAGMAVTSTLAATAIQSRNAAREQRRQAEGLVAFMVGDLRDKLEPIGKLDVLDRVGSRVLDYYSTQDTAELTDDALVQRSRALNLMAEVAFNRGKLAQAEGLYRQAMTGTAEAVRRSPGDTKRIFDHAQNVFWVGEVARFEGHPAEAEAAWREYKRLADRMASLEPDNLKYRMEVFYADEDVGISLYNQHRFAEAGELLGGAEEPMEKLISVYRSNTTYQKEFATLLQWGADVQRSRGNFGRAIADRERQISILEHLIASAPDSDARERLATAHEALAIAYGETGQADRSVREFREAIDQADDLMRLEPHNAQWKKRSADARLSLGLFLSRIGRFEEADREGEAGCALAGALPASDANAVMKLSMICAMLKGRLALRAAALPSAVADAQRALASARAMHSEDPIADRFRIAQTSCLLGDARARNGEPDAAKRVWLEGLSQLPVNVDERPLEMQQRLDLLERLNRSAEARRLEARLKSIGYQSVT